MGNKLFGKDIAGVINAKLGPLLLPLSLVKVVSGARNAAEPSAGSNPTQTSYPCRGILDSYRDSQYDETIIKRGDRKALILGDSLPTGVVPQPSDKVVAEGRVYNVVGVDRDPDAATYTCQVRGA